MKEICFTIKNIRVYKTEKRPRNENITAQEIFVKFATIADNKEIIPNGRKMPSKQNEADVLAVEELVHEIRENLRLKARPSHHPNRSRPSPYHIPCRSWSEPVPHNPSSTDKQQTTHPIIKKKPAPEDTIDDPYELLQQLIKTNNLVKEAVRRLQHNFSSSPKQRYFYESDEESHSPIVMMCQLES